MNQGMFKVGGRVKIYNPRGYGDGKEGTILEIAKDEVFPYIVLMDNGDEAGFESEELRHTKNQIVTDILNDL